MGLEMFTFLQSSHLKGLSPLGPASAVTNGFIAKQDQAAQTKLSKIKVPFEVVIIKLDYLQIGECFE